MTWYSTTAFLNILENHQRDLDLCLQLVGENKQTQWEWNRFHQSRYDTIIEAFAELFLHLQDPPTMTDDEYFNGSWGYWADPDEKQGLPQPMPVE